MDRDRAVELGAVAARFARVVADASVDRRERVVGHQATPRQLVLAGLDVGQPRLDVLAGRTGRVARRQQIDVDGSLASDRARLGVAVGQVRQRREVGPARGGTTAGTLDGSRWRGHTPNLWPEPGGRYRRLTALGCG